MKNYYLLSNGRLSRKDHTLFVENAAGEKKPIPVEDVDSLYVYGEVDLNSKVLNFLTQKQIALHVFNYYGFYSGSYYPREYLHSGFLLVKQAEHYSSPDRRLALAREFVDGAGHSLLRNVAYYTHRRTDGAAETLEPRGEIGAPETEEESQPALPIGEAGVPTDADEEAAVDAALCAAAADESGANPWESVASFEGSPAPLADLQATLRGLASRIAAQTGVNELRGIEGKMRERYYHCWRHILAEGWVFTRRVRRPPDNEVNALVSFGNGVLYTSCLSEIYRTQLTPTISFLHEPGSRRFSLALDLSEIFKPLIVDRAIFRLLNTGQIKEEHFARDMNGCFLNDTGKKLFLSALEERFTSTIKHRRLGRHVSYRHLIRLECYKLIRHLTGLEPYRAFRAWW